MAADRVCVAQIGAPHGVRGEVRLKAFTADPMAVGAYGALESEDGTRRFTIKAVRPAKEVVVARLDGVHDREAAERLRNLRLYVPRTVLPPPDEDEFYYADLIGLTAVTADGAPFGKVAALHNFGAGDLIEIVPDGGGSTILLPFTKATVPTLDVAAGRIVVDPPDEVAAEAPSEGD